MSKAAELAALIGSQSSLSSPNMIINGDMVVAQRGTSTAGITSCGTTYYTCDRWGVCEGADATITIAQSTVAPEGFKNSFKLDTTTADASLASTQYASMFQKFEGFNLQQLKWGTSNAKPVTLSFYVKSNKTGTYVVNLTAADATNKYQSQTYTIDSADTWEKKTITYIGETTTAIPNDNTDSMTLEWGLASGTGYTSGGATGSAWSSSTTKYFGGLNVNILDHTDNEFLLTGVQLEVGEVATPYKHESYGDNLARCQRYYQKWLADSTNDSFGAGHFWNDTSYIAEYHLQNTMRSPPALTFDGTFVFSSTGNDRSTSSNVVNRATKEQVQIAGNVPDNDEIGKPGFFRAGSDADAFIEFSAELQEII